MSISETPEVPFETIPHERLDVQPAKAGIVSFGSVQGNPSIRKVSVIAHTLSSVSLAYRLEEELRHAANLQANRREHHGSSFVDR